MQKSGESAGNKVYAVVVTVLQIWSKTVESDSDGQFVFSIPADVLLRVTDASFSVEASYIISGV